MKDDLKHLACSNVFATRKKDQGVHRPLDQVLDGAGRQSAKILFRLKASASRFEDDVAENDHQRALL